MAAAILLAMAEPAAGYRRSRTSEGQPLRWNRACVTVQLNAGEPPPSLDPSTLEAAARAATTTWSAEAVPCTLLRLQLSTSPEARADAVFDGRNNITFRRVEWRKEPCDDPSAGPCEYDPMAMAVTTVFALPDSGQIVDADIEINAVGKLWADLTHEAQAGAADLQNVLTHELGHLIGLDHSPHATSVMYATGAPGEIRKRELSEDDVAAVCEVYPVASDLTCLPPPRLPVAAAGCAVAGRPPGPGPHRLPAVPAAAGALAGVAALVVRARPRRRR